MSETVCKPQRIKIAQSRIPLLLATSFAFLVVFFGRAYFVVINASSILLQIKDVQLINRMKNHYLQTLYHHKYRKQHVLMVQHRMLMAIVLALPQINRQLHPNQEDQRQIIIITEKLISFLYSIITQALESLSCQDIYSQVMKFKFGFHEIKLKCIMQFASFNRWISLSNGDYYSLTSESLFAFLE